ncbi:MAG TPA: hypothetical protein V6C72_09015, partial [Chroococcales cyanobacterium]
LNIRSSITGQLAMAYHPSNTAVRIQRNSSYFAIAKAASTLGYFLLCYLTWRLVSGQIDWELSTGCLVVSGAWLLFTRLRAEHLLQTYFDVLSRIEIQLPMLIGVAMSVLAIWVNDGGIYLHVVAALEIFGWIWIFKRYSDNRALFKNQGYGPVPLDTWVNPPAWVMQPGDLILTSGEIGKQLHESVSHGEVVIKMPNGELRLFSSYMGEGVIIRPLEKLLEDRTIYYVGLHLARPLKGEQVARATEIAEEMLAANQRWKAKEERKRKRLIDSLPLPRKGKEMLSEKLAVTGYDWFGMFMGRIVQDRWTCIGAAVELYHRLGIKTKPYGTGLLGFGTTILDPIMPVRFFADPAFKLITVNEKQKCASIQEKRT